MDAMLSPNASIALPPLYPGSAANLQQKMARKQKAHREGGLSA
jgi:hypothetical protein